MNNQPKKKKITQPTGGTLRTPVVSVLPDKIRRLLNAACAARGGADCMTLNDWRETEQEIKRQLKLMPFEEPSYEHTIIRHHYHERPHH